jgi:hypothetical protein
MLFLEILPDKKLDIYSFFLRENTISCPDKDWLISFQASLRRKHEVLLIESPQSIFPIWDPHKRWCVSKDWIWMTPRSLSFIKSECDDKSMSFQMFRDLLLRSK